jgi:hypothetical protein
VLTKYGLLSLLPIITKEVKKTGDNLVQGFGPTTTAGDREVFVNTNDIVFDTNATYSSSNDTDCQ